MEIREHVSLLSKTTMRIGGEARFFGELSNPEDVEKAAAFAREKGLPLFVLGSGSNTIFASKIEALVVQIKHSLVQGEDGALRVGAGKNLAMLINESAQKGLDLSPLTGIPGTVGGAIFGNAGQGPGGTWIDAFVESVTVFTGDRWRTLSKDACGFHYRESVFKTMPPPLIIWEVRLRLPPSDSEATRANVDAILRKRIETQPHQRTAGSCFKAAQGTPAWKLIDAAGLRGRKVGGIEISTKHANFLLNTGGGTYDDAVKIVEEVKAKIPEKLEVEMRFVEKSGDVRFS